MPKKTDDFEKNLSRLEEISSRLSNEDISLDEASKLYEEGDNVEVLKAVAVVEEK